MHKVVHLIPYDGIGGVERAARSVDRSVSSDIDFRVETILPGDGGTNRWLAWNPLYFLLTAARLWHLRPDVLIVSLWRAYALGILHKLLRPGVRLIVFLHFPDDVHGLDRFFSRLAARMAIGVWADSNETLARRLPGLPRGKGRVISFVTERVAPSVGRVPSGVRPVFIFWGRIHPQKGLLRALHIFAGVHAHSPEARFVVIGPDGGDLPAVRLRADALVLTDAVDFRGGTDFTGIQNAAAQAAFYLQTSELEGMAMSVVEAMQLGLVPVVTPVGEIGRYCRHGQNAVLVTEDGATVAEVLDLLDDDARFQTIRANAMATWLETPLYKDDVLQACRDLLHRDSRTGSDGMGL